MAAALCQVDECSETTSKRGWCNKHYLRWKRHGDPLYEAARSRKACVIDDCDDLAVGRGWCMKHWQRWRSHGDPLKTLKAYTGPQVGTCAMDGCIQPVCSRHWCKLHYSRWLKHGDPRWEPIARPVACTIKGCEKPARCRGMCSMHNARWERHGDTEVTLVSRESAPVRLELRVDRSPGPNACHLWTGPIGSHGYGVLSSDGRQSRPHVVAWEAANGRPVPKGSHIDHECHNQAVRDGTCTPGKCDHRRCCNERHLICRTQAEHRAASEPYVHPRGSAVGSSRLTETQVLEIKALLAAGMATQDIADRYSVGHSAIWCIRTGRTWGWLDAA